MEGYELYDVEINDELATALCFDITGEISQLVSSVEKSPIPGLSNAAYRLPLSQYVNVSPAWVRTQIDRRRLMKKSEAPTTVYSVQGENARLNVNSSDKSVNVVIKPDTELLAELREQIKSKVADDGEQRRFSKLLRH